MVHDIVLIGLELEHGIDHEFKIGQISNTAKKKKKTAKVAESFRNPFETGINNCEKGKNNILLNPCLSKSVVSEVSIPNLDQESQSSQK